MEYVVLVITAILIKNILLAEYLGNCPFIGTSKKMSTAIGMGMAVIFTIALAGALTWAIQKYALNPLNLGYLQTIVFILVIAALVQLVEFFLKKSVPPLYKALGIFLPLITTNCAVLGIAVLNIRRDYNFLEMLVFSIAGSTGFSLALILMTGIRERYEITDIPRPLQGTAISLITAGLMAMAFLGFSGVDTALKALQ
ncbi:MAG: electron transport complex subunit RsxA [Spirochaetes bacterium RBG_16_49_21]|nr:MAG: electron transport complex subunit RsxA [Spirochaetes bacterium RBG_16_49_21]